MEKKISERKKAMLEKIVGEIKKSKIVVVASLKGIPSFQLQKIRKMLKEKASIRVAKKNLLLKAFETCEIPLSKYVEESSALLFSCLDPFELSAILSENKIAIKAKAGQTAEKDIKLEKGITDLPAGPLISTLNAAGIKVGVEEGKIVIREEAILVKAGQKISQEAAEILSRLEISPFEVWLTPIAAYDREKKKIYTELKIDKKEETEKLKKAFFCSFKLATEINYTTRETINFLLRKAFYNALALK